MKETGLLILVKHSQPVLDFSQPANQWHLSPLGKQRCKTLAERLSVYQIQAVISSLEPKAIETAQITAEILGLPVQKEANLHEHERSQETSVSVNQFEAAVAALFAHPDQLIFGSETASQALQRFEQAIHELVARTPARRMAVISHGTVISLFAGRHCGVKPHEMWKRLGLPSFIVLTLPAYNLLEIVDTIT